MKIARYETVCDRNPAGLDRAVNQHLEQGWQLYGSAYAIGGDKQLCCQPMVLDEATGQQQGPSHEPLRVNLPKELQKPSK